MAKESMKAREVKRARSGSQVCGEEESPERSWRLGGLANCPGTQPRTLHNRCSITGRPKGYMREFGISRIQFREMASNGLIPGVRKASW